MRRWREHAQLEGHARYGPLLPHAVVGWGDQPRSGAGDPSLWWATSCTGRLSVLDRGRAVPRVWRVIAPGRATGADEGSKARWERAAPWLPRAGRVGLLADRGGAETTLRRHRKPRWALAQAEQGAGLERASRSAAGSRSCSLTGPWAGPMWAAGHGDRPALWPRAAGRGEPAGKGGVWGRHPRGTPRSNAWAEEGLRCDSAEPCVEDHATGLPVEASLMRSAHALERWCGVLAMPPLSWVSQGPSVVQGGKRRLGCGGRAT